MLAMLLRDTACAITLFFSHRYNVTLHSQPSPHLSFHPPISLTLQAPELGLMQLGGIVPGGAPSMQLPSTMTTNGELDPEKLLRNTGKKIGVLGKAAQKAALGVEKVIFKGLDTLTTAGQQQPQQPQQQYQAMPQQQYHQQQQQQQQQYQQQQPQYQPVPQQSQPPRPPQQQQQQQPPPKSQNTLSGFFGGL